MHFSYLILNILVVIGPFLVNIFLRTGKVKKTLINYLKTVSIVGTIFIIWDFLVTDRGDWSFNPKYTLGAMIGNLPFEEVLFFITIPFASIALYELIIFKLKDRPIVLNRNIAYFITFLLVIISIMCADKSYTSNITLVTAVIILASTYFKLNNIFLTKNFYVFILAAVIPFFIVNSLLTAIPIVFYNPDAILNIRVGSIPIEDFLYSFCMLSTYLAVYFSIKHNDRTK